MQRCKANKIIEGFKQKTEKTFLLFSFPPKPPEKVRGEETGTKNRWNKRKKKEKC